MLSMTRPRIVDILILHESTALGVLLLGWVGGLVLLIGGRVLVPAVLAQI